MDADKKNSIFPSLGWLGMGGFLAMALPPISICVYLRSSAVKNL